MERYGVPSGKVVLTPYGVDPAFGPDGPAPYGAPYAVFVGLAQWACENEREENLRVMAATNPHSPGKYRINGVVVNMPEFAEAFQCKAGDAMVREKVCRVW